MIPGHRIWRTFPFSGTLEFWKPSFLVNESIPEQDWALSCEIMVRWANFAKTGNPNTADNSHTVWDPVPGVGKAFTSNLRTSSAAELPELPVLVFGSGPSQTEALPIKAQQCAAFPFGTQSGGDYGVSSGRRFCF
jgi:hypothetical protein